MMSEFIFGSSGSEIIYGGNGDDNLYFTFGDTGNLGDYYHGGTEQRHPHATINISTGER